MNTQAQYVYDTFQRPRGVMCGVCARLAEASALPVWMIRVVAVGALIGNPPLTVIGYLLCAAFMRRPPAATWRYAPPREDAPPCWHDEGLSARFGRLDARLADLEREAWDREAGLRRAFRDLR